MKKTFLFFAYLFSSALLFSQDIYLPGLVVKNSGDTLRGWVGYGNWKFNPEKIEFKTDSNSHAATPYTVADIQYFEINGRDAYRKATVTKDMRPVDPVEITAETTDTSLTGTYFLRVLVNGRKFSLYEYLDFKEHFFVQEGKGAVEELLYKLFMNENANSVGEWNNYKEQLISLAGAQLTPALDQEINNARYTDAKLTNILIDMNGGNPLAVYGETKKKKPIKPQFFGSAGAGFSTFNITGSAAYTNEIGLSYSPSISPAFSVGMDLLSSRNFSDLTFRFEITASFKSFHGKNDHYDFAYLGHNASETYDLKQQNITPSLSVMYNFRRTKKVKYYAGLGLAYNLSGYSLNRYVLNDPIIPTNDIVQNNPLNFEKVWPMVFLRAGVRLNRKFEIGFTGDLAGSFLNYENIQAPSRTYTLKFVYFFL